MEARFYPLTPLTWNGPNCFVGQMVVAPIHDYHELDRQPSGPMVVYFSCSRCGDTIARELRSPHPIMKESP